MPQKCRLQQAGPAHSKIVDSFKLDDLTAYTNLYVCTCSTSKVSFDVFDGGVNYLGIFPKKYNNTIFSPRRLTEPHKLNMFMKLLTHMPTHSDLGNNWLCFGWVGMFYVFANVFPLRCPLQGYPGVKKKIKMNAIMWNNERTLYNADCCVLLHWMCSFTGINWLSFQWNSLPTVMHKSATWKIENKNCFAVKK